MSSDVAINYFNARLQNTLPHELVLSWNITAAKTVSPCIQGLPVLPAFDPYASQAVIDNFLGTTNEFLLVAFDATALGANMFAGIIDMKGQAFAAPFVRAATWSGTDGQTVMPTAAKGLSTLTASTLKTECAVGAFGNLAFKCNFGAGFDALTSGLIIVTVGWLPV